MCLNKLLKLWLTFCCHQQKIHKWTIFDILMTFTVGVPMIMRQMTPSFSSTLWDLFADIFHFWIARPSNFSSICIVFWPVKYIFNAKDDTFEAVKIGTLFYIKFAVFWYITCWVPNFLPIWPQSHGLLGVLFVHM